MRVKVTDIKQTVQGYDATITPILQHPSSSTPPSITGRQPQNSSHSSDESPCTSFNQEEWNSVQQSTLLVYKEIFSALTSKKLPDQDTLREIHTKRDTNALTDLMMSETSDGHFFDLTRICHGMRDFVDITLPDSVIALSEGLVLEGFIDGQRVSVDGTNLNTNDIQRLQEITQINGKAFIQILTEFIERVTFK